MTYQTDEYYDDRAGEILERLAEDTRELAYLQAAQARGEYVDHLTLASFRYAPRQLASLRHTIAAQPRNAYPASIAASITRRNWSEARPDVSYEHISRELRAGAYRAD